jgi:hypothetical protein
MIAGVDDNINLVGVARNTTNNKNINTKNTENNEIKENSNKYTLNLFFSHLSAAGLLVLVTEPFNGIHISVVSTCR